MSHSCSGKRCPSRETCRWYDPAAQTATHHLRVLGEDRCGLHKELAPHEVTEGYRVAAPAPAG